MTYRIQHVQAVDASRLDILWTDGFRATVDFARLLSHVPVYAPLRDPGLFRDVRLYEYGHSIYWESADGSQIDICPDVLRAEVDPEAADWIAEMETGGRRRPAAE